MACAVVTACRRTTRVKSMSIGREKLFNEKATDVHPVIPVLSQFVEELCDLIVDSVISVMTCLSSSR